MCNCFKFILIVIAMGVTEEGFCKNLGYSNSAITDYFRSNTVNSGSGASWGLKSSWESSNDNITWSPATEVPTSAANIITIRNGFNIDIKSGSESADQLIIEAGAILTFSNGSFTVDDGSGTDMVLAGANSNFIISSNTDPSIIGNSLVRINSGAKITLSGNSNIAFYQTNQFSYADASNFEYAGTNIPVIQITFFQNQDVNAIPLFIYNSVIGSALGGVGATTINGKLEVSLNKTMNVSNVGGTLTVRNGIIGAGNYVNSTSSVTNITGASAEIGGTGNLDSYISIANGSTTTLTSNKSYLTLNVFIVNGIYDLGTNRISVPNGASTITVGNTGTLRTANINGLTGAGSIGANLVLSTLPNGSTVEYYSTFPQVVTALSYQNITLNGNSIKTASGPLTFGAAAQNPLFNINAGFLYLGGDVTFATGTIGVMTIANGATLNTANSTNQLTGSNVASIQVNGKFVTQHTGGFNGTSTAVPGIPIILNINSTVEFGGTNQAFQSLASGNLTGFPTNIIFSGSGIKTGGSISTLSSGLITIRNTVIVNATAGASFGVTASALTMEAFSQLIIAGSGTQPNMGGLYTLEPTSTIEFAGTSGSIIRLSPIYANLIVSGINISNTSTTTGINFQSSTFTVKNGATFSLRNLTGFSNTSGVGTTAISNISAFNPTIILEPNSTINYDGITNQVITNTIPYQNLKFSGTSLKTAPLTNLLIEGNLTRAAISTFSANGGRVVFQGSIAQTFTDATGLPPIEFYNLSNTNTSNVIVNNSFAVQNELNLTPAAKLYLNTGDIILRSTNLNTAYITSLGTAIPSTLVTYNNGRFQIERYLRARSSWRLLATPVEISSSPSITNSWREGELVGTNSVSQYGTRITGPTGMDEFTQRYSMKSYNGNNNNYAEVNTPAKLAGQLANNEGYYIFVRGDRTVGVVGLGSTTLRMKGKIRTGDQTFSVPANILPSAGFQSIGNPYPSAIDFRFIDKKNIAESYYIWNPDSLGEYGVGKFEQYSLQGIHYTKTPGGDIRDSIQSGEAFFVQWIPCSEYCSNFPTPYSPKLSGFHI